MFALGSGFRLMLSACFSGLHTSQSIVPLRIYCSVKRMKQTTGNYKFYGTKQEHILTVTSKV